MNFAKNLFVLICVIKVCFAISNFEPFKEINFVLDQNFENEIRQLDKNFTNVKHLTKRSANNFDHRLSKRSLDQSQVSKRSIGDHYEDGHCVESFETSDKTIIRTIESKSNGAVFLNNSEVETYERCLRFCCETNPCTVAVWDQQNGGCYLFDCGPSTPEDFKCRFTGNEAFTSGALLINRRAFEMSRWDHQSKHENTLQDLVGEGRGRPGGDVPPQLPGSQFNSIRDQEPSTSQQVCGQYEFSCQSGDCIAVYDVCNGIAQCLDGSDEDPSVCPTTTVKPNQPAQTRATPSTNPVTSPFRPSNIEQWGREGERFQAGTVQAQPAPAIGPAPQQQPSPFQHRNPAIQVPPFPVQQQQQLGPRYGADYNSYGFQPGPQQQGYYPSANAGYRVDNGYYMPPGQQQPYPVVDNRYPVQSFPNVAPAQQPQQQQQQYVVVNPNNNIAVTPSSNVAASKPSTKSSNPTSPPTTGSTTENREEILKNEILKNLTDEDFVMETPSAALFTLIFGSLFSGVLCVLLICRCRSLRKNRSRKRNLASDADGDYLVNGMYL